MLKSVSRHLDDLFIGVGFCGVLEILFDRIKFYLFFQFYYSKKFQSYGKNIRWGRDFRKLVIPRTIRLSCLEKISIGDNCKFDDYIYLQCDSGLSSESGIFIGRGTRINAHTHILAGSSITIEEEVLIAPFCLISSNNHCSEHNKSIMRQGMKPSGKISIGKGSWIGQNAKVLGGAQLGEKVVVGTGAIVIKGEYPSNCKVLGQASSFKL